MSRTVYRLAPGSVLDPSGADMALHRHADMVWAIAGTRHGGLGYDILQMMQAINSLARTWLPRHGVRRRGGSK